MRIIHGMKVLSGIVALLLACGGTAFAGKSPDYPSTEKPSTPPSEIPEIDANTGGTALALLIGGLLLVSERAGSSRRS